MPVCVPTLAVAGDLDLVAADPLTAALENLLAQGHRAVHLDLSDVTFLDCAGLGVLVDMHHRFVAAGACLTLAGVGRPIMRVIRLADLQDVLGVAAETAARTSNAAPACGARP